MIGVVDVEVQAKNPNLPLWPLRAYVNSPTSLRLRNVPRKIGTWQITSVNFQVTYPDGAIASADCVLVGGVWVGTVDGTSTPGKSDFGYAIYASGIDEHRNPVTGYCLGKGDVEILDDEGSISPSEHATYTTLLSAMPENPKDGYIFPLSGEYYIWQNGAAHAIGDDSGAIDELKGDIETLSAEMPSKQDKLTVAQGLALDSVVGERETKVLFLDGTTSSYYIVGTLYQLQVQSWSKSPVEVVVGNAVTRIGNSAFRDISSLATVTIPDSVISIGDGAFKGCSNLTSVTIPDSVTSIGDGAFRECSNLTSVMIGNGVTSIGNSQFRDCTSLSSVSTPNTISAIGTYAFYHTAITSFNFPKNLQHIGTGAFTRIPITALEFNDGLLSIDSYCFRQCSSLTDIEIPESVETLGYAAFMETDIISSAVFKGRTMEQVSAMQDYPWNIPISAISTENDATKEWVEGQDYATETYAVQNLSGVAKIQSMELSDYQAISATADLSTLYVIPEEV